MIFNFFLTAVMLSFIFFPLPTVTVGNSNDWNTEDISQEEEIEAEPYHVHVDDSNYYLKKATEPPEVSELELDLDGDEKSEKVTIKSYPGFPGDQNTEVYINSNSQPALTEIGAFYAINNHKMDNSNHFVTELQLQTGQSLNTLFYSYKNGKLNRISVSTEKPPSWYGIISRNIPEFKDVNNDGRPELLAYYNFLYDPTRKVEVYKFTGSAFQKIKEYEEPNPDRRL